MTLSPRSLSEVQTSVFVYTVKSFLFVGHLILRISWLGEFTNLRSQQNIYLIK